MVPAPTPYVPAEYSTLSAGTFNGEPLVEVLHSYPHFGSDDYEVSPVMNTPPTTKLLGQLSLSRLYLSSEHHMAGCMRTS